MKITITEAEQNVLEVLWDIGYSSSSQIYQELFKLRNWSRNTTKVYLERLQEKKLIGLEIISQRKHCYYPLLTRKEFLAAETSIFLNDHYDKLSHMIAGLIDTNNVTDDDITELEQLIEKYRQREK